MKKGFWRVCSLVLVLALLVNMLPMSVFAEEVRNGAAQTETQAQEQTETPEA